MQKIKVLHIVNIRYYNATAWYAFNLSRTLCAMGHDSTVLTLEGTVAHNKAIEMGIPLIALPYDQKKLANFPRIFAFLEAQIQQLQPDIVNCHRGELYPLFIYLKKKYHFKLVRTRGDQRPVKKNIFNKYFYKYESDALIATNSRITQELVDKLQINPAKVHTILGGVDTKIFFPKPEVYTSMREKYSYTPKDKVIGLLGRLDPIKGQEESICALAKAIEQGAQNLKLCIIGFDEFLTTQELYRLADTLNIREHVYITGKVQNVNNILNMCDAALLSSVGSEAIARAALEFMACHIPLLSSHVGVMPDLVDKEGRFSSPDIFPASIDSMAEMFLRISKALDGSSNEDYTWLHERQKKQEQLLPELTLEAFAQKSLTVYRNIL